MRALPDAPDISRALNTGYPFGEDEAETMTCAKCRDELSGHYFVTDEGSLCQDCFEDYVKSYANSNPVDCADAIGVTVRWLN